jgi:uncharacterized protein (TIGR02172 family)
MRTVDLKDWTLFRVKNNTDNYFDSEEKTMLKVYKTGGDSIIPELEREQEVSRLVNELGIKTPKVGDLCRTTDGRLCMTYENIRNKKSLSRAISEDLSLMEPYMELLANTAKLIHGTKCTSDSIPSYKELFLNNLEEFPHISEEKKEDIKKKLAAFPDDESCLHGDFHPGNFIIAGGTVYAIDLGGFTKGNFMYDIAEYHTLGVIFPPEAQEDLFHVSPEISHRCFDLFIKYYFGGDSPSEKDLNDYGFICMMNHKHMVKPFAVTRWLNGEAPYTCKAF